MYYISKFELGQRLHNIKIKKPTQLCEPHTFHLHFNKSDKKINHHSIYTEHPSQHYFQPYKKATDVIVCDSKVILNYPRLRNKNAPAAAIASAPIPAKIPALFVSPVCGIEAFFDEAAEFATAFLFETVA